MKTAHGSVAVNACMTSWKLCFLPYGPSKRRMNYRRTLLCVLLHLIAWEVSFPLAVAQTAAPEAASPETPAAELPVETTPPASIPLSARIDRLLEGDIKQLVAPRANDGELLRRLSLDLRGVVPSREELDAFTSDATPDRWANWVNRFLSDPMCDEHLVNFLDRTLMLRRPNTQVDRTIWRNHLREQVAANVPIDQLVKPLLYSPWWNREQRTSQKFFLERGGDANLIARDIGRVFLGRDMQCAQCHDHPLVEDYKQIDYHGLMAFVAPGKLADATYKDAEGKDQKVQLYVEQAAGDATFESVFDKGIPFRSGPRLPSQTEQFEDYLLPDDRYQATALADALPGVGLPPKQSRRTLLAEQLAARSNRPFVANWANRLWAFVFGQGLVHPIDMHHAENPAIHPEVFALITDGLVECDMQPRKFIAELVLSQAYQRGDIAQLKTSINSAIPTAMSAEQSQALRAQVTALLADTTGQQETLRLGQSTSLTAYETARDAWREIQAQRAALRTELDASETAMLGAKTKVTEATTALAAAKKRQADTTARIALLDESGGKLQQAADLAGAEDAELKQAITVAKQRSDAARAQLPELEMAVVNAQAASQAALPVLAQATDKVQEIAKKLAVVHVALKAADAKMLDDRATWSIAENNSKSAERNSACYQHILGWLDALQALEQATLIATQSVQVAASIEAEVKLNAEAVSTIQSQLQGTESQLQAALVKLTEANSKQDRQNAELNQLNQTLDSLLIATKLIPSPETLAQAQQAIQAESETRRTQVGQLKSDVATVMQAVEVAKAKAAQHRQEIDALQITKQQIDIRLTAAHDAAKVKQSELSAAEDACREQWTSVSDDSVRQLELSGLYPLSPEQLCWSTLRVTGQLDAHVRAELAELDKQSPLATEADAATKSVRYRQAVRLAYDKLRGNADAFVGLYASGSDKTQDDFFASADQALYSANAGNLYTWAGPGNNNVTQQAIAMTDSAQIAHLIYWTLLCRQPTDEEKKLVIDQLATAGESRSLVIQEMIWSLLVSAEFRFCH